MNVSRAFRLACGWGTVALFFIGGSRITAWSHNSFMLALISIALFSVILWSAFGVVAEADHLAEALGEPLGTLILTLSIVLIEVTLVSAATFSSRHPTLGRDTMFAVLMIVLNGIVGLGLLFGGLKHGTQRYNQQGANSYLLVIIPLSVICFVLPNFTISSSYGTLHPAQAVMFSIFTLLLYGAFLVIQTGAHRDLFSAPEPTLDQGHHNASLPALPNRRPLAGQIFWLLVAIGPVVLLSKFLAQYVNTGLTLLKAPPALGGLLIAIIVLAPEGISAIRAISANQLQRAINLCLGASASTLGLTLPAILVIGLLTHQQLILGLSPLDTVLMVLTLALNMLTFSGASTTLLEGAMHLIVFFVYISLIFVG